MNNSGRWCRFRGANLHLQREAARIFADALRVGTLVRRRCTVCGAFAEGHHEDYAEPTRVIWLCRFHHSNRHQGHSIEEMRAWRAAA